MTALADTLLKLENVTAGYGDAVVLHGISLELPEHGSLAVLGRNGVGKSTLLLTIMGYTQMRRGAVAWRGRDISRQAAHRRALNGIGWVAQEREIFPSLSVEENLKRCSNCFHDSRSGAATWATSFPAASSRCWRSRAR
jgi:branched-chain amino acid transport system ATP-binding protein